MTRSCHFPELEIFRIKHKHKLQSQSRKSVTFIAYEYVHLSANSQAYTQVKTVATANTALCAVHI
jgi:hypothetical protein